MKSLGMRKDYPAQVLDGMYREERSKVKGFSIAPEVL